MSLSEQLKAFKKKTGESIPEIAEKTGIPEANLYKWQNGTKPTNIEHYNVLIKYMDGKLENVPHGTVSAADHISMLKDHNETLKEIILANLTVIQASLKTSLDLMESIHVQQSAHDDVMMGAFDKLLKNKEGTLAAKSDKLEFDMKKKPKKKDNHSAANSVST